jgi:hypothetical protein
VLLYRKLLLENAEKVERGEDPLGVIRDPDHAMIDTNLGGEAQGVYTAPHPTGINTATVAG